MRPPGATAAEALSRLLVLPAAPAPALRSATGGRLPFLSARLVELTLGPFGPGPQVGPCFLQHRGAGLGGGLDAGQLGRVLAVPPGQLCLGGLDAGLHGLAQLVTFPGRIGPHLVEHPGRFLVCPVGVGPGGIRARLGCGGPLLGGPGGVLMLARLLACLVAGGLGRLDEGLGLGPGPFDRLPRVGGRAVGALTGGSDGGGLVRLGAPDRAVAVFFGDGDAGLGFLADPVKLGGVRSGSLGQPFVSLPRPGLSRFCVLPGSLGLGLGCLGCLVSSQPGLLLCGQLTFSCTDLPQRLGPHST